MNIKKRLEKLETSAKIQVIKIDVTRIIVDPDGNILSAIRRDASGEYVPVLEEQMKRVLQEIV